jgi:hypothetical protein
VNGLDAAAFARLFRSSCNLCGSGRLTWGSVSDLVAGESNGDEGWLGRVAQGLGVDRSGLLGLEAWRCSDCGEVGVFGPLEVGP